jgi:uncharacterized protein
MAVKKKINTVRTRKTRQNDTGFTPYNYPLNGVFDYGSMPIGGAGPSQPWEMANAASYNLISLQRVLLTYSYTLFGPLRTLVDQPVYDAFRGGFKIKSDEVDQDDLDNLERELKRLKFHRKMQNALRWDRLFGGAGVIINVDQDYEQPLNLDAINEDSLLDFIVADRWELAWNGIPNAPNTTFSYWPGTMVQTASLGLKIHQSRVAKIIGEEAPSLAAQRLQGWGMSAIECVLREINSYFKEQNVIFELLDEAKVDVWKIKGFNSQLLSAAAQGKTANRLKIAANMKNFLNAITLDSEDDYEQKQLTFSGLSEMLEQIRIGIAAAVRMPMSKIFGLQSKAFSSGEDDLENYNALVEGQRERAEDVLDVLIPIVCKKVWGFVPDDLKYEWRPLRVLSAEQTENVKSAKFERLSALYSQGILNPQEYCEALKNEDILTMETEVGKGLRDPEPVFAGEEDGMEEPGQDKKDKPKGKDDADS